MRKKYLSPFVTITPFCLCDIVCASRQEVTEKFFDAWLS